MKNKGSILILSGCAGSGKGTVLKELYNISDRFRYSVSLTTRKPRPGEIDGVSYHFTTRENFLQRVANGELCEYTEYCGNLYGTLKSELEELRNQGYIAILEIETDGALQIMKQFPEHRSIFIVPPSYSVLEARLRGRGTETQAELEKRLAAAKEEILLSKHYQNLVINFDNRTLQSAEAIKALCLDLPTEGMEAVCRNKEAFVKAFLEN
ncbi:MAG: guanylate kinase [Ruminococcaceae bacterium]|nr:guanylate kinase [Oscillospiraceae bacterium]